MNGTHDREINNVADLELFAGRVRLELDLDLSSVRHADLSAFDGEVRVGAGWTFDHRKQHVLGNVCRFQVGERAGARVEVRFRRFDLRDHDVGR